jgi:hypothetical protein
VVRIVVVSSCMPRRDEDFGGLVDPRQRVPGHGSRKFWPSSRPADRHARRGGRLPSLSSGCRAVCRSGRLAGFRAHDSRCRSNRRHRAAFAPAPTFMQQGLPACSDCVADLPNELEHLHLVDGEFTPDGRSNSVAETKSERTRRAAAIRSRAAGGGATSWGCVLHPMAYVSSCRDEGAR